MNKNKEYAKIENILKNYKKLKVISKYKSKKSETYRLIVIVEEILKYIEKDEYYMIIPMVYFDGKTQEQVAEFYNVDYKTISRNKKRLLNEIKVMLFSDEVSKLILNSFKKK